jgi:hypothetical protein
MMYLRHTGRELAIREPEHARNFKKNRIMPVAKGKME